MKLGTKSVLFGAHQFMIHPWFVAKRRESLDGQAGKYETMNLWSADQRRWYAGVQSYLARWVDEHRYLRPDTWTPEQSGRVANSEAGVWK